MESCWDPGWDYDQDKARSLLMRYGHLDVEHFLEDASERLEDYKDMGFGDDGWNLKIKLVDEMKREMALKFADKILRRLCNEEWDKPSDSWVSKLPKDVIELRTKVHVLLRDAQESSFKYARKDFDGRHTDYPSYSMEESLMWLTTSNRQVQLKGSLSSGTN